MTVRLKLDNWLKIYDAPQGLRDHFMQKLQMANPTWVENHRMGRWNRNTPRTLTFYQKAGGNGLWVPRGCARQVVLYCRNEDIPYALEDRRRRLDEIQFAFKGHLRTEQKRAVDKMLSKEFGTLCAPTGGGKTVMALNMIAQRRQPALIVVHTKALAHQWIARIGQFLNLEPPAVGLIGAGQKRFDGCAVTVALVQSLYRCADDVVPHIGFVIVDECHRIPSRTFTDAVAEFDAHYMLGITATPMRRDKLSKLIFWHLGDLHHEIQKAALLETGDVLDVEVVWRVTDFEPYHDAVQEYSQMLSELTADDARNHQIAADIAQVAETASGVCLVLSDRKRHCHVLQSILTHRYHLDTVLLTGDLSETQRQQVMTDLDQNRSRILIATGQLVGEGFDYRALTTLFITTPIRFQGRLIQYLGRVLRPAPGKDKATVYDYVDMRVGPLLSAAKSRHRVYQQESASEIPFLTI